MAQIIESTHLLLYDDRATVILLEVLQLFEDEVIKLSSLSTPSTPSGLAYSPLLVNEGTTSSPAGSTFNNHSERSKQSSFGSIATVTEQDPTSSMFTEEMQAVSSSWNGSKIMGTTSTKMSVPPFRDKTNKLCITPLPHTRYEGQTELLE